MANQEANRVGLPAPGVSTRPAGPMSPLRRGRWARLPRWARLLLGGLLILLIGLLGYAADLSYTVVRVSGTIYQGTLPPLPSRTETAAVPTATPVMATPQPGEPTWTAIPTAPPTATAAATEVLPAGRINILVLGTDKRAELADEAARSDTLIVISVDPQWKTAGILSIPRDLQVPIPGYGLQKINAAYFYGEYAHLPGGGATLAVPTVSQFFDVPIQYYVEINFEGFQKIVDMIGGIDVYVPEEIDDPQYPGLYNDYIHVHFNAGCQHLNGEQALQYARTRHADSDFGRNRRQQQVIKAVRERVLQLDMLPRYGALVSQLGDAIQTNIPPDQQWMFAQLGGQIRSPDIYTAQIDSTLVREISGSGNLELRRDKAKPVLDWFFGRGAYAKLKPGTLLPSLATATAAEAGPLHTAEPLRSPLVPAHGTGTADTSPTAGLGGTPAASPAAPPAPPADGKCP